jgi:hypothetical protein
MPIDDVNDDFNYGDPEDYGNQGKGMYGGPGIGLGNNMGPGMYDGPGIGLGQGAGMYGGPGIGLGQGMMGGGMYDGPGIGLAGNDGMGPGGMGMPYPGGYPNFGNGQQVMFDPMNPMGYGTNQQANVFDHHYMQHSMNFHVDTDKFKIKRKYKVLKERNRYGITLFDTYAYRRYYQDAWYMKDTGKRRVYRPIKPKNVEPLASLE